MKLSDKIEEVAKSEEIQNVSVEVAETMIDLVIDEGVLKDIPIIGSIVGVARGVFTIKDRLFTKKLLYFLNELKVVPDEDRLEQIQKINESNDYQLKVGDKLLFCVDKSEDSSTSALIGKLFVLFLSKLITYDTFVSLSQLMNSTNLNRIKLFCATNLIDNFNKGCLNATDLIDFFNELSGLTVKQLRTLKWVNLNYDKINEDRIIEEFSYFLADTPELENSNAVILLKNCFFQLGSKQILDKTIGLDHDPLFPDSLEVTEYGKKIYECLGLETMEILKTQSIDEIVIEKRL